MKKINPDGIAIDGAIDGKYKFDGWSEENTSGGDKVLFEVHGKFRDNTMRSNLMVNGKKARGIIIFESEEGQGVIKCGREQDIGPLVARFVGNKTIDPFMDRVKSFMLMKNGVQSLMPRNVTAIDGSKLGSPSDLLRSIMGDSAGNPNVSTNDSSIASATFNKEDQDEINKLLSELDTKTKH